MQEKKLQNLIKISIIVPIYNTAKYLRDCLDSIYKQNFDDYEIICINDGSTDGSEDIVKLYAVDNPRLKLFSQKNAGQSSARNLGLSYAKGEYICFLDSDDMLIPGALEDMYREAEARQIEILSYEVAFLIYENEELKRRAFKESYCLKKHIYNGIKAGKELFVEMMEQHEYCEMIWLLLIKRKWLEKCKIQFYPGIFYEDNLFTLQCFLKCDRMCHVKQKNYIYRIREDSTTTANTGTKKIYSYLVVLKELLKELFEENNQKVKKEIANYISRLIESIRRIDNTFSIHEKADYNEFDSEEKLLADLIAIRRQESWIDSQMYLMGFERLIKEHPNIILYGAGGIGQTVYKYLKKINLHHHIKNFAVTACDNKQRFINGIQVFSIYNLTEKKDEALVLITANNVWSNEMQELAKTLGFRKIKKVDCLLEELINKQIDSGLGHASIQN